MQAIVDIGNTRVKAALFEGRTMQTIIEVSSLDDPDLLAFLQDASIQRGMCAATGKTSEPWRSFIDALPYAFHSFDTGMHLPFENEYRSPKTLGADRLANVAAAQVFFPKTNCLVIDAGSCVTYDLLEEGIRYKGGLISPGLKMRQRSMHSFTERLPLVEGTADDLMGRNTEEALRSGAFFGLLHEVKGLIGTFSERYSDLQILLTGGDAPSLEKHLENSIFARPQLALVGLNELCNHHFGSL